MVAETLSWKGEPLPTFAAAPHDPAGYSPVRRRASARRTSSIDAVWPEGRNGVGEFFGHARDIVTPREGGAPITLAEDRTHTFAEHRVIREVTSAPPRAELAKVAGSKAGGHLRAAIDAALHDERVAGTPLYLLLDDLAGATLVAAWAFSRWQQDWRESISETQVAEATRNMEGICIGFRPGSGALGEGGQHRPKQNATKVLPLINPADPEGWHELVDRGGTNFRRARRIDVWHEHHLIQIDAAFQDSASAPEGGRVAIHEYRLTATADPESGTLLSVKAVPGTLPYKECPAAAVNVDALVGSRLRDLRDEVLITLRKTAGCTHLNDALRALAEVPRLAAALPAA